MELLAIKITKEIHDKNRAFKKYPIGSVKVGLPDSFFVTVNAANKYKERTELHAPDGWRPYNRPVIDHEKEKFTGNILEVFGDDDEILSFTDEFVALTQGEIEAIQKAKVPKSVKNMKLRLALIQSGISISSIDATIQTIEDTTVRESIQTMWEYAEYYERENTQLIAMAASLGITDEQLDQLFILAETL